MNTRVGDEGSITPIELQAELNTLRSLRRRSISQPSDGIDPDLPPSPSSYTHAHGSVSPTSPTHHTSTAPEAYPTAGTSASAHGLERLRPRIREPDNETDFGEDQPLADNLSELFWLPARLHPEIAPQEFRNYMRDQTRPENLLRRSGSQLGRKKSMLSRQYHPSDSESESASRSTSDYDSTPATSPAISRQPSRTGSFRRSTGLDRLTLADLQKLEAIARQAAEEGQTGEEGEAQLKRLVRRSLSLNPAAILGAADQLRDDEAYNEDDTDSPLVAPPPGSILRRSARTKIRKNSLLGDGGGHRFGPSRRGSKLAGPSNEGSQRPTVSGRRHASLTSLESYEDDATTPTDERTDPISHVQHTSPKSPERLVSTSEALPMQYVPSEAVHSARVDVPGPTQQNNQLYSTVTPARSGADMPPVQKTTSPTQYAHSARQIDDAETMSRSQPTASGSLRTTRRIAANPPVAAKAVDTQPPGSTGREDASRQPQPVASTGLHHKTTHHGAETRPSLPRKSSHEPMQGVPEVQSDDSAKPIAPPATLPQAKPQGPAAISVPHAKAPTLGSSQALQQTPPVKEKERKSAWAKLGLSRTSKEESDLDDAASIASNSSSGSTFGRKGKKNKKDKATVEISPEKKASAPTSTPAAEKPDGPGGFFGGLFGKKKPEPSETIQRKEGAASQMHMQMPTPPPTASGMLTPDGKYINFYRLPIHIERAVYRLSHIKLANPRRPLYEQVLISNLMFWYLGVINKPVVQPSQMQHRHATPPNPPVASGTSTSSPKPASPSARPGLSREHSDQGSYAPPESLPLKSQVDQNAQDDQPIAMRAHIQEHTRPQSHPPRSGSASTNNSQAEDAMYRRPRALSNEDRDSVGIEGIHGASLALRSHSPEFDARPSQPAGPAEQRRRSDEVHLSSTRNCGPRYV